MPLISTLVFTASATAWSAARAPMTALRPAAAPMRVFATTAMPSSSATAVVEPYDEWTQKLDYTAFREEVHQLGERLADNQGKADTDHLNKMIRWSNVCGLVGMATMWTRAFNPVSVMALSLWTMSRWTMIAHHTCHGGYNRQDDGTGRFTSKGFAVGSTAARVRDWFDWMLPEAWNVEHNNLHHYRLGERGDPDLVERNMELIRDLKLPRPLKYMVVAGLAAIWKWYYYAPNTYKQLKIQEMRKAGVDVSEEDAHAAFTLMHVPTEEGKKFGISAWGFMRKVMGPYLFLRFLLLPAPLLLINRAFFLGRGRQPRPRGHRVEHPLLHHHRDQPRGRRPLQVRELGRAALGPRSTCARSPPPSTSAPPVALARTARRASARPPRRPQRLHARVAQLPDRAPRVAAALDALVPEGGAARSARSTTSPTSSTTSSSASRRPPTSWSADVDAPL